MMNCLWNTVSFSIRKTRWKTLISPKSYTTSFPHKKTHLTSQFYSSYTDQQNSPLDYLDASDSETFDALSKNMLVVDNFITAEEEQSVYNEVQNYLKRLRYEVSHWDDAIHGYRETEKTEWNEQNKRVLDRVRALAFPASTQPMTYIHVLDLQKTGFIKPHIDSVRFCGDVIAGISLLSPSVMRLVHENDHTKYADCLLKQRSLYIMKNAARYDYTHEVLKEEDSKFRGTVILRDRRISVICRCEYNPARQPET